MLPATTDRTESSWFKRGATISEDQTYLKDFMSETFMILILTSQVIGCRIPTGLGGADHMLKRCCLCAYGVPEQDLGCCCHLGCCSTHTQPDVNRDHDSCSFCIRLRGIPGSRVGMAYTLPVQGSPAGELSSPQYAVISLVLARAIVTAVCFNHNILALHCLSACCKIQYSL